MMVKMMISSRSFLAAALLYWTTCYGGEIYYEVELEHDPEYKLAVTRRHVGFFRDDGDFKDQWLEARLSFTEKGQIKSENTFPGGKKYLCRSSEKENIGLCLTDSGKDNVFRIEEVDGGHNVLTAVDNLNKKVVNVVSIGEYDADNDYYPITIVNIFDALQKGHERGKKIFVRVTKYEDGEPTPYSVTGKASPKEMPGKKHSDESEESSSESSSDEVAEDEIPKRKASKRASPKKVKAPVISGKK